MSSTLETRVQALEDERAIQRILIDYAAHLDFRHYAAYADLFAPDGEWTGGNGAAHKGRQAIHDMLAGFLGPEGAENHKNFHIISNAQVDVNGDTATATSRFFFIMRTQDGRPQPSLAGIYRDELVRQDGRWFINRRVAQDIMPTPEEWQRISAEQGLNK